jgi:hypothetical protein
VVRLDFLFVILTSRRRRHHKISGISRAQQQEVFVSGAEALETVKVYSVSAATTNPSSSSISVA